jgi:ferredoxin
MSQKDPWPDNVPGKYYIDLTCINCGLCPALAPNVFAEAPDGTHSFAYAQPEGATAVAECEDAVAQCPSQSVRNDGDQLQMAR